MKSYLGKMMIKIKNKICLFHETLVELIIGIFPASVFFCVCGMFFVTDKISFCLSLFLGACAAVLLAVHMFVTIDRSLDMYAEDAGKYCKRNYVFRLIFMILLILCGLRLPGLHFPGLFLGLLTLKVSVYLRPVIHRFVSRMYGAADPDTLSER